VEGVSSMMRHALLALLLLAGCSSGPPAGGDGGSQDPICFVPRDGGVFLTGLPTPVPGCAADAGPTGLLDLADLGWSPLGGLMLVPPAPPGVALPVIFVFHGSGGTGAEARDAFGLEGPADGGAILVYPNGGQSSWDIGPRSTDGRRVDSLLGRLADTYCIDPARVSIAGYSAGAVFALYLGCNVPGTFQTLTSVAGTDQRFDTRCCSGSISALFIHGEQDDTIPLSQGQTARSKILHRDQCSITTTPVDARCVAYACPAPLAVEYCEWFGGHAVPDFTGETLWRFVSER
jgi:Putative esterase